jgi:hypothetical protein
MVEPGVFSESLHDWTELHFEVLLAIRLATSLRMGRVEDSPYWSVVVSHRITARRNIVLDDPGSGWGILTDRMNEWLSDAGSTPLLVMEKGDRTPSFAMGNLEVEIGRLYGALGIELTLTLAQKEGFRTCRNCGRPFTRPRGVVKVGEEQGREGGYKYCEDCGIQAAWRLASRKRREKATRSKREPAREKSRRRK